MSVSVPDNDDLVLKSKSSSGYPEINATLYDKFKDGDIVIKCGKDKAYPIVGGIWNHAGIFSKDVFDYVVDRHPGIIKNTIKCIYSAQPNDDKLKDKYSEDMAPDRYGYACLDTINQYNKAYGVAILTPKERTDNNASQAVDYAKTIYYDTDAKYNLPWGEALWIGNTSHDLTNKNTYCSKVPYTAWKKVGISIDGEYCLNNLVVPDDIFMSAIEHSTGILWWYKHYPATTDIAIYGKIGVMPWQNLDLIL